MIKLEVVAIDDSLGVVLPSVILSRLGIKVGDTLYATETLHGFQFSADCEFAEDMEIAEKVMREDCEVLRRLAQ